MTQEKTLEILNSQLESWEKDLKYWSFELDEFPNDSYYRDKVSVAQEMIKKTQSEIQNYK
jgi:hypothetical protein